MKYTVTVETTPEEDRWIEQAHRSADVTRQALAQAYAAGGFHFAAADAMAHAQQAAAPRTEQAQRTKQKSPAPIDWAAAIGAPRGGEA